MTTYSDDDYIYFDKDYSSGWTGQVTGETGKWTPGTSAPSSSTKQWKFPEDKPVTSSGSYTGSSGSGAMRRPTVPEHYRPGSLRLPTYTTPVYEDVEMGEIPTFTAPEYKPPTFQPSSFNLPGYRIPKFNAPVMESMPTFTAPEYDESEITKKTQKYAAPGVRNLRAAVQESMAQNFDNPNVKSMTLKSALAGYGEGLESVMAGAGKTASAEYAQEYAYQYKEAGMNYDTAVQTVRDKYQGQMSIRQTEFAAEMNAVNTVYQAEIQKEQSRIAEESRVQQQAAAQYAQEYAYQYKEAGMNYDAAVQAVRDKYQGQVTSRNASFQAELNAVNTVYQAEIQREQFRLAEESRKQMFDAIWDSYESRSNPTNLNPDSWKYS